MVYERVIHNDDPLFPIDRLLSWSEERASEHEHALPFVGGQPWWLAYCVCDDVAVREGSSNRQNKRYTCLQANAGGYRRRGSSSMALDQSFKSRATANWA
jgi:hypothetical protein